MSRTFWTRSGSTSELFEPSPGRTSVVAHWGDPNAENRLLLAWPPRRRAGAGGRLEGRPVLGRDPRWLRLGPRCGRHEGLRRHDPVRRTGPGSSRCRCPIGRSPWPSPPTRRPAASRVRTRSIDQKPEWLEGCTEGIGEVGGFSATINDRRIYLIETAEKGLAWLRLRAHGTAGHGSMRNADNAVTALAEAVAAIGRHRVAGADHAIDGPTPRRGRRDHRLASIPRRPPTLWSSTSGRRPACWQQFCATRPTRPGSSPATSTT